MEYTSSGAENMVEGLEGEELVPDNEASDILFEDASSDAEWAESGMEDLEDYDENYSEEDENYVGYCSTSVRGVFVNAEMYAISENTDFDRMMNEYIDGFSYAGTAGIKRSDIQKSDDGSVVWIVQKYSEDEDDDAYQGLILVHAVGKDDKSYTKIDIYAATDADMDRLNEFLDVYGLKLTDAAIAVEQISYD